MRWLLILALAASTYESEIAQWRQERETKLKAPDGWLSVAGLQWLKPGENEAPLGAGRFKLARDKVTFEAAPGANVTINGKPSTQALLKDDQSSNPDVIEADGKKLLLLRRGNQYAVRLKDNDSEYRRNFQGLKWYPVRPQWRIQGRFVPYPKPRAMKFDSTAGGKQDYTSPGYVEFAYKGQKLRLTPVLEEDQLFFVFRDRTAGKATYPARFLYADMPKGDQVIVDFNKAYNPPCVFTPYATCPLPPPENRLQVAVEAGELMYAGKH
jgi:uncharacterized protein